MYKLLIKFFILLALISLNASCKNKKTEVTLNILSYNILANSTTNEDIILDSNTNNIDVEVIIENKNRLSFVDMVLNISFFNNPVVFSSGNSKYSCNSTTELINDRWTTTLSFNIDLTNWDTPNAEITISEIRFIDAKTEFINATFNNEINKTINFHRHYFINKVESSDYLYCHSENDIPTQYFYSCVCGEKGEIIFNGVSKIPHKFEQIQNINFLKEAKNCYHGDIYYYGCSCGKYNKETYEIGIGEHDYQFSYTTLKKICSNCNEVDPNFDSFEDIYDFISSSREEIELKESWEGKEFIEDGIGEVTVKTHINGDTTIFEDKKGREFTVKYYAINTPDCTSKIEPWGYEAKKYTINKIDSAHKIVLQCDNLDNRYDLTGLKYVAWVWLIDSNNKSSLLNFELAEVALAKVTVEDTKYNTFFKKVVTSLKNNNSRIYGYNNDPDYDYTKYSKAISLKEIKEQYGTIEAAAERKDEGKKVIISGVVARRDGTYSAYIQQYSDIDNKYYGVYVYGGFFNNPGLKLGNSVVIEGKIGYYFGTLQLTDISVKVNIWASNNPQSFINIDYIIDNSVINVNNPILIGSLVNVTNLTVTGGYDDNSGNAFTVKTTYVNESGQTVRLDVRVGANINLVGPDGRITSYEFFKGKTIKSITAVVSYYDSNTNDSNNGYIQLMLTSFDDIIFDE